VPAFCLMSMALTYALVSNFGIIIGTIFGERLMYFPSAFFVILVAWMLTKLRKESFTEVTHGARERVVGGAGSNEAELKNAGRNSSGGIIVLDNAASASPRAGRPGGGGAFIFTRRRLASLILMMLIGLGALRSFTYAARWNDPVRFYELSLRDQPQSVRLHMLVAGAHRDAGNWAEAERACASGRAVLPDYHDIWSLSGEIARQQGKLEEAEVYLKKAFDLWPNIITYKRLAEVQALRAEAATRPSQGPGL